MADLDLAALDAGDAPTAEPQSVHNDHRPLLVHESLAQTFTVQENRKVSMNLTLHYNRVMYMLDPSELADGTRGNTCKCASMKTGPFAPIWAT
jgi:hypothetical protein